LRDADQGAAMVEFAIVGSILSVLVLGIMEAGIAAWQKNTATADAREAARYAAVHGARSPSPATVASVRSYIKSRTTLATTGPDSIRVYVSWPGGGACASPCKDQGYPVWVSIAHRVPRRGPFIPTHVDSVTSKMIIMF
jgi:Flp pilus assembly protein TadG